MTPSYDLIPRHAPAGRFTLPSPYRRTAGPEFDKPARKCSGRRRVEECVRSRHRASRQCGAATDRFRLSKRRCAVPAINAYAGGDTGWSHAIRHGVPMLVPLLAFSQRQWQHRAGL